MNLEALKIGLCCGLPFGIGIFLFLSIRKRNGAKSNYTEVPMNEYNHPVTWKDNTDYGE